MCSICFEKNDWTGTYHLGASLPGEVETPHYALSSSQGSTGSAVVDGVISGVKWDSLSLTYNFPATASLYGANYGDPSPTTNFAAFTASMQNTVRSALTAFSSYTNLTFTELSTTTAGSLVDIAFGQSTEPNTAFAYYPSGSQLGGDVWFGRGPSYASGINQFDNAVLGTYEYLTYLHEIGHSLGLKHAHETGGIAGAVIASRDAMEFSVMSYRSYVGASILGSYSNGTTGYAQTLMMLDIAALQEMYGADYTTQGNDSVYTFNAATGEMLINGIGQGTPGGNTIFRTAWDGGGVDTYNFSNFTEAQNISLAAGGWSLFSSAQRANLGNTNFARANLYNALQIAGDERSLIENAISGSGNDRISGNQVANDLSGMDGIDTLVGQGGNDILRGGAGNDILYGDFEPAPPPPPPVTPPYTLGNGYTTISAAQVRNTAATAINLTSNFTFSSDSEIENSTTVAHSSVTATGNGTADWYKVTLNNTNRLIIDIDNTGAAANGYDSFVRLFASDGVTLLDSNDDSDLGVDVGSGTYRDSRLSYTANTSGVFYISVGTYQAETSLAAGTGYEINVSVDVTPVQVDPPTMLGIAGNDTLDGGTGNDTMTGGAGDDIYIVDSSLDQVIELAGGGTDTVRTSLGQIFLNYDFVENLELLAGASSGFGNGLGNTIFGNAASNLLVGLAGNDIIGGDAGNDTLIGDSDSDFLNGGADNDTLWGGSEADTLWGETGDDILIGGSGVDAMVGGAGNDIYFVEDTGDSVTEAAGAGGGQDTAWIFVSNTSLANNVETGVLIGTATSLNGTAGNDILLANSAAGSVLFGAAGQDTLWGGGFGDYLSGGADSDTLIGLGGADTFGFTAAGFGFDVVNDFSGIIGGQGDRIDLRGMGIANFAALSFTQYGVGTTVNFGADTILLWNMLQTNLRAGDFIFA